MTDGLGETQLDAKRAALSPSNPAARVYPTTGKMLIESARPKNRLLTVGIVIFVFAVFSSAILVGYLNHLNGASRHGLLAHSPDVPGGGSRYIRGKEI
ncbi:MAG: hypothetical protein ACRECL_07815 [Bradyrhizobium sp.]